MLIRTGSHNLLYPLSCISWTSFHVIKKHMRRVRIPSPQEAMQWGGRHAGLETKTRSFSAGFDVYVLCLGKFFNLSEPHSTWQRSVYLPVSGCLKERIHLSMSTMEPASQGPSIISHFSSFPPSSAWFLHAFNLHYSSRVPGTVSLLVLTLEEFLKMLYSSYQGRRQPVKVGLPRLLQPAPGAPGTMLVPALGLLLP